MARKTTNVIPFPQPAPAPAPESYLDPETREALRLAVFHYGLMTGFFWMREHVLDNGKYKCVWDMPDDALCRAAARVLASAPQ